MVLKILVSALNTHIHTYMCVCVCVWYIYIYIYISHICVCDIYISHTHTHKWLTKMIDSGKCDFFAEVEKSQRHWHFKYPIPRFSGYSSGNFVGFIFILTI
jgi:hypothetical protein